VGCDERVFSQLTARCAAPYRGTCAAPLLRERSASVKAVARPGQPSRAAMAVTWRLIL
jgi:hypothetical protein